MPRPRAPEPIVKLSRDFALLLTAIEDTRFEFIARHGKASLFHALSSCVPSVVPASCSSPTDAKPSAGKLVITEPQFLKVLQKSGAFKKFRHRKASRIEADPSGAGMCMFQGVRWKDPSDASDYDMLAEGYQEMCAKHPIFARQCSFEQLLTVLSGIVQLWYARWPEFGARRGKKGAYRVEEDVSPQDEMMERKTIQVCEQEDSRVESQLNEKAIISANDDITEMFLEEPCLDDFCFLPESEISLIPAMLAVSVVNEIELRNH